MNRTLPKTPNYDEIYGLDHVRACMEKVICLMAAWNHHIHKNDHNGQKDIYICREWTVYVGLTTMTILHPRLDVKFEIYFFMAGEVTVDVIDKKKRRFSKMRFHTRAYDRMNELITVINTINDPAKAPALAGIDWAEPIMEELLR
jgi:hypothetical protein